LPNADHLIKQRASVGATPPVAGRLRDYSRCGVKANINLALTVVIAGAEMAGSFRASRDLNRFYALPVRPWISWTEVVGNNGFDKFGWDGALRISSGIPTI
jgi:hypothetical protein